MRKMRWTLVCLLGHSGLLMTTTPKPLFWIADTKEILSSFPEDVRDAMGFAHLHGAEG